MKIVYNSFDGRYSDSPKALAQALDAALLERGLPADHTWIASGAHAGSFPAGAATVPRASDAADSALSAADLVISNTHLPVTWTKKPGARYVQTWHGTPLKRIAGDEPGVTPGAPVPGHLDIARWDLLLAPNAVSAPRLAGAFAYDGPVAVTGYPRNDVLRSTAAPALRARVRERLGLDEGDHVVLYTPTWRDDVRDARGRQDVRLALDLHETGRRLTTGRPAGSRRSVLLMRLHYMVSERLGRLDVPGVVDVSRYPDIAELYLAADAMVTDYSSTMFDFAVTGKPLLFYVYDLEHYRDSLRGFYVDLESVAPGPLLRTPQELLDAVTDLAADPVTACAPHRRAYAAFAEAFCHTEDGGATDRVLALIGDLVGDLFTGPRAATPHPRIAGDVLERNGAGAGHAVGPAALAEHEARG